MLQENFETPYYAVIFTSLLSNTSSGYEEMAVRMKNLAKLQKGFLGVESARADIGITISYWKTEADIIAWKNDIEHSESRKLGREKWYQQYQLRVCLVERNYGFKK
ncbi:antibiotic biosynthesis monooxygenase [uncultured Polaribacter sp.]|uniref:antibiotic biosynthesis monooxygenase family protein n=1 Tax=uncultured Polaribacter sp. TaxID=174711 RepID=UPI0026026A5C|nr:antibiotic biosynthesis monooxygenase [uncultured Polaribacter sp.]